jgi:hypothetical protein
MIITDQFNSSRVSLSLQGLEIERQWPRTRKEELRWHRRRLRRMQAQSFVLRSAYTFFEMLQLVASGRRT